MKSNGTIISKILKQSTKRNIFALLKILTKIDKDIQSLLILNLASVLLIKQLTNLFTNQIYSELQKKRCLTIHLIYSPKLFINL